jgi:hypothetical protein
LREVTRTGFPLREEAGLLEERAEVFGEDFFEEVIGMAKGL